MAIVVSGIDSACGGWSLVLFVKGGVFAAGAVTGSGAAVACLRLMSAVSATASAAKRTTTFHRICMKTSPVGAEVLNHIAGVEAPASRDCLSKREIRV